MARTLILLRSSLLYDFISPLVKKGGFGRCSGGFGKHDFPLLFGIIEQTVEVYIVPKSNSDHCGKPGEAPLPFQPFLHHHEQQVCNERHPNLDLDGIGTFSIEAFQREILFNLLEEAVS